MKSSSQKSREAALFARNATAKWLVLGVLIIGIVRVIIALVRGGSLAYVFGTTMVSVILAGLIYVILWLRTR